MPSASEFLLYVWQNAALHAEDEADAIVVGCAEDMVKDGHLTKDQAIEIVESFGINLGFNWEKEAEEEAKKLDPTVVTKAEQKEAMEFLFGPSPKKTVQTVLVPPAVTEDPRSCASSTVTVLYNPNAMDVDDDL